MPKCLSRLLDRVGDVGNGGASGLIGICIGDSSLLMDVFKGWLSVNYIFIVSNSSQLSSTTFFEFQLAFGVAAVIGHLFPIYTGFRGGKGIATLLGLLIGLNWLAAIVAIVVFVIVFLFSKYVSLGSILASFAFPFVVFVILDEKDVNASIELFSVFVPILTLITHQKNIERIMKGQETKLTFGKK